MNGSGFSTLLLARQKFLKGVKTRYGFLDLSESVAPSKMGYRR